MTTAIRHLAAAAMVALALDAAAAGTTGGVTLRDGALYNQAGRRLAAPTPDPVVAATVSAGGRYIVFVRQQQGDRASGDAPRISMWIHDRRTGKPTRAGRGLGHPCCELANRPGDAALVFGKFEQLNGAFWSRSNRVLVRFVGQVHILSMDGSLQGDV